MLIANIYGRLGADPVARTTKSAKPTGGRRPAPTGDPQPPYRHGGESSERDPPPFDDHLPF